MLLLDEPDAHLHVILQDAIYGELRAVAAAQNSQLIIATHSEVIINAVEPRELCVMLAPAATARRTRWSGAALIKSLGVLLERRTSCWRWRRPASCTSKDYTDLEILREWAKVAGSSGIRTADAPRCSGRPTCVESRAPARRASRPGPLRRADAGARRPARARTRRWR